MEKHHNMLSGTADSASKCVQVMLSTNGTQCIPDLKSAAVIEALFREEDLLDRAA